MIAFFSYHFMMLHMAYLHHLSLNDVSLLWIVSYGFATPEAFNEEGIFVLLEEARRKQQKNKHKWNVFFNIMMNMFNWKANVL